MQITDVRVNLTPGKGRLRAYCTIVLDNEFVVKDVRIIDGNNGLLAAMPSRKLNDHCPKCGGKNHLQARFCNDCGAKLPENRVVRDERGKLTLGVDIAHPINAECRQRFEQQIIEAYNKELDASQQPGYKPESVDHLSVPQDSPEAKDEPRQY